MSDISEIVEVNITRETSAVDQAAFNIPLFVASHTAFTERAKTYASLEEITEDFRSTSNVYKAAFSYFGQETKPPSIVIGRRQVNSVTASFTVQNSSVYSLVVNGVTITYTSDSSALSSEIAAGLTASFGGAGISGITCTNNLDGTITIAVSAAGTAWSITSSTNITLTNASSTEAWPDAIAAVDNENDIWYCLSTETHVDADIEDIAEYIQAADTKIYAVSSSSAAILTSSTSDIASTLHNRSYDRVFILYSASADTTFPECGWVGDQLPQTPGSNTWAFKTIVGTSVDKLSTTQVNYAKDKKCNTYRRIGGQPIAFEGTMASGEFIDTIIFIDWMKSRIQERVYGRLVNLLKIPFTNAGLTIVENEIRSVQNDGISNGGLKDNPAPWVIMPDANTVPFNDKATRTLDRVRFGGTLANAIHYVKIQGTLTL